MAVIDIPGYPVDEGEPVDPDTINAIVEALVSSGIANTANFLIRTKGGVIPRPGGAGGALIQVKTPSGGIAARSSLHQNHADCYLVSDDSSDNLVVGTNTVRVWNYAGNAAPGNKFAVAALVNGRYKLISWEC